MKSPLLVARFLSGRGLRRTVLALGLCAAALGTLAATAQASPAQFIGNWYNIDPATRDIVRFQIGGAPGALGVHVYGACEPTACDWGISPLTTYGDNVSDPDHKYATAVYNFGFVTTTLTFQLTDPYTMVVQSFDKFNDGSGRQNFHTRQTFRKIVFRPLPLPRP